MNAPAKKLIAGNWKMYKNRAQARELTDGLLAKLGTSLPVGREVLLLPPFTALETVAALLAGKDCFALGAQNFYPAVQGAFTGEISPVMLQDLGCTHALAGHSERRHVFKESDAFIAQKVALGIQSGLHILLCIGETLAQRKHGSVENVLKEQLRLGLKEVDKRYICAKNLTIAYEPVWAIGTGEVAESTDILAAHALIRATLAEMLPDCGKELRILYGGSVKPDNAATILCLDNVDGVLVGGASLQVDSFAAIATAV
jgi:triosephosphate isomerase